MRTLDDFLPSDRSRVEDMNRRRRALEAKHPVRVPKEMLLLDKKEFRDKYRERYGVMPSAPSWSAWLDAEKAREVKR